MGLSAVGGVGALRDKLRRHIKDLEIAHMIVLLTKEAFLWRVILSIFHVIFGESIFAAFVWAIWCVVPFALHARQRRRFLG